MDKQNRSIGGFLLGAAALAMLVVPSAPSLAWAYVTLNNLPPVNLSLSALVTKTTVRNGKGYDLSSSAAATGKGGFSESGTGSYSNAINPDFQYDFTLKGYPAKSATPYLDLVFSAYQSKGGKSEALPTGATIDLYDPSDNYTVKGTLNKNGSITLAGLLWPKTSTARWGDTFEIQVLLPKGFTGYVTAVGSVPLPPALGLFATALLGLAGVAAYRRRSGGSV